MIVEVVDHHLLELLGIAVFVAAVEGEVADVAGLVAAVDGVVRFEEVQR